MNNRQKAIIASKELIKYCNEEAVLDGLELAVLREIVLIECERSLFFFSKYVLGFNLLTEETHEKWADDIQRDFLEKDKIMRLKPRGTLKTTLYGISFILWLWCIISPELKIFYTSAGAALITETSAKLSGFLEDENSLFQLVFGLKRDPAAKHNTNDIFNIIGGSRQGHSLILRTAGGSTNGVHPHVVIVDDPMDDNDRNSRAVREKKKTWFDTITPLIVPFTYKGRKIHLILVISTRWHMKDLIDYILGINKRLREEKKWSIEVESIYKDDVSGGESNYPEFITRQEIQDIADSMDEIFFACQYRNKPLPKGALIFDKSKLHQVKYKDLDMMTGKISCFFDPARGVESGDFPAPIWTSYDGSKVTLVDAIDEKNELTPLLSLIANKNKDHGVSYMQFESNGTTLIKETLDKLHKELDHYCYIEEKHRGSEQNKENRIVSAQPDLYSGFFQFLDIMITLHPEMWDQLTLYPAYGHDDFPDVIETAISYYRQPTFEFVRYEAT